MKANTVVVISGRVCAPTKPVPEHPMMDLGEAESHPGLVYKIEMFDYERDLKDFLSSCVPFEDQMRGLVKLGLAHDIPDGIPKENHPYTVPDYEFEVKSVEIMNGAVFSHFVAVLVDEKKVEPTPPKDLPTLELLELVCQLHDRAQRYPSKPMHDAYVEARNELESRIGKEQESQDKIWDEVLVLLTDHLFNPRPGNSSITVKMVNEMKSLYHINRRPK